MTAPYECGHSIRLRRSVIASYTEGEAIWEVRSQSRRLENILANSSTATGPIVVPVAGGEERLLPGFIKEGPKSALAFGPHGRLAAVGGGYEDYPPDAKIRVWDLDSDEVLVLDPGDGKQITEIAFTPDGALVSASAVAICDSGTWPAARSACSASRRSGSSH